MKQDVVIVDIIGGVVNSMQLPYPCYFDAGRTYNIMQGLNEKDNSLTSKDKKYPLIALMMPFDEHRGQAYYGSVRIPRIVISAITTETDNVLDRYATGKTFKSILYPVYYEFLSKLAASPNVVGQDPDMFTHIKRDNPGQQPIGQGMTDYIDSIEILNLELIIQQIKTC